MERTRRIAKILLIVMALAVLSTVTVWAQAGNPYNFPSPQLSTSGSDMRIEGFQFARPAEYDQVLSVFVELRPPTTTDITALQILDRPFDSTQRTTGDVTVRPTLVTDTGLRVALVADGVTTVPTAYSLTRGDWQVRFSYSFANSVCAHFEFFSCLRYSQGTASSFRTAFVEYVSSASPDDVVPDDDQFYSALAPNVSAEYDPTEDMLRFVVETGIDAADAVEVLLDNTLPLAVFPAGANPGIVAGEVSAAGRNDIITYAARVRVDGGPSGKTFDTPEERSYVIPANGHAYTPFTSSQSINIYDVFQEYYPGSNRGSGLLQVQGADPRVVDAVGGLLVAFNLAESRTEYSRTWLRMICFIFAVGAALLVAGALTVGGRPNAAGVGYGLFVFVIIWTLIGTQMFAVPYQYGAPPVIVLLLFGLWVLRGRTGTV